MRNDTQGTAPKDAPLPVDAPKIEKPAASHDEGLIGPVKPLSMLTADAPAAPKTEAAKAPLVSRWPFAAQVPLAAAITVAAAIGALAGSAVTGGLMYRATPDRTLADDTQALRASVARLNDDFAAFKSSVSSAQRTAGAQVTRLSDRVDRAEKAQAEPVAKIAKLTESLDRVERRQQQAAAAAAAGDVTGSIAAKEDARPPVAEGWRLRDYYSGRAIVESRNGTLFEVGPGSNLPGLGKVEAIRRENGRMVVVARNGIIVASSEPRRPPAYVVPYRY